MDNPTLQFTEMQTFSKVNADKQLVTGWASVVTRKGDTVVDHEGDVLDLENLREVAQDFIGGSRTAGIMHKRAPDGSAVQIGRIVESIVIDKSMAKTLGISSDNEGWLITVKVDDPATWADIKAGKLSMFSIGGRGSRVPIS